MTTIALIFILLCAAASPSAISTRAQPAAKPPIVLEKQVKRAAAVQFHARLFDRLAAARYRAPGRVEFRLLDGRKVRVSFQKPTLDAASVSWSGRIDGSKFGTGTIVFYEGVLYEGVVSGSLRLDDGRVFDLVTAGKDVWMREIDTAMLDREAEPREAK